MLKCYSNFFAIFLTVFLCIGVFDKAEAHVATQQDTLKVALVDNLKEHESVDSQSYTQAYMQGLSLAGAYLNKNGYKVIFKKFFYGKGALGITKIISSLKNWHPDIILGPRHSNQFIMLSKFIEKTLVLSTLANSSQVYSLPSNFYTLNLPAHDYAKAVNAFVKQDYLKNHVVVVIQAGCASCVDVATSLSKLGFKDGFFYYDKNLIINKLHKLKRGNKKVVIILLADSNNAFDFIIQTLPIFGNKLVFIGVDSWGPAIEKEVADIQPLSKLFVSFRFMPDFSSDSKLYGRFVKEYRQKYNKAPTYDITYLNYKAVLSIFSLIKTRGIKISPKYIYYQFLRRVEEGRYYFRPTAYFAYYNGKKTRIKIPIHN